MTFTRTATDADVPFAEIPFEPDLLERLCRIDTDVVFFPVRHHSPVAARLVAELIVNRQPSAVLIEGPSDFNDHFHELLLEHDLPIAIYSYFRCQESHFGAYYPFCEYSPEWLALRQGNHAGAIVRFIDLPWAGVAQRDQGAHRYADAELRRGKYVRHLCERMQVEDFDDLWDKLIESQASISLEEYFRRVHAFCYHTRLWEQPIGDSDIRREAFMAEQIRLMRRQTNGQLLVVTGGFHSSALAARLDGYRCPGASDDEATSTTDKALPKIEDAGISLTSYSYSRLDNLTGYEAGMPNPGFYEHAWRQRQGAGEYSHQPLLVELVNELRDRRQTLSTADLIAVETTARALAALRGRLHVWRRDLIDAVTSSLIKDELEYGCQSPFVDAIHAVLRGKRRGRLAAGTRLPPLVHDIRHQLNEANLEAKQGVRSVTLDLLKAEDLSRSRLLHRLRILGIVGFERTGGTDFLNRADLTRLWEEWRVRWSQEFDSTCIEASRYGTSLADAAGAKLAERSQTLDRDAARAAELLVQAAQAGIETLSATLLQRLNDLIEEEPQFIGAAGALGHVLYLYFHDEAFGTNHSPQIARLLAVAFERSLWLLESIGQSSGNERVVLRGMQALLETCQRASGSSVAAIDRAEFVAVLQRVERDARKPAAVRGAAAGMLWTLGVADDEQILADLLIFTSPSDLGDFLAGLFALAREVAQRHAKLVQTIDRLINEFGADDFQASLPSLRLAFTYFTPREKHYMLTTLFESLGLKQVKPLEALHVDAVSAAQALAFEERVFEMIARFGLESPPESTDGAAHE